jgi:hypothetical protein
MVVGCESNGCGLTFSVAREYASWIAAEAGAILFCYFKYSESFFNSSGTTGIGGQSAEYPFSSGVATSERKAPS